MPTGGLKLGPSTTGGLIGENKRTSAFAFACLLDLAYDFSSVLVSCFLSGFAAVDAMRAASCILRAYHEDHVRSCYYSWDILRNPPS